MALPPRTPEGAPGASLAAAGSGRTGATGAGETTSITDPRRRGGAAFATGCPAATVLATGGLSPRPTHGGAPAPSGPRPAPVLRAPTGPLRSPIRDGAPTPSGRLPPPAPAPARPPPGRGPDPSLATTTDSASAGGAGTAPRRRAGAFLATTSSDSAATNDDLPAPAPAPPHDAAQAPSWPQPAPTPPPPTTPPAPAPAPPHDAAQAPSWPQPAPTPPPPTTPPAPAPAPPPRRRAGAFLATAGSDPAATNDSAGAGASTAPRRRAGSSWPSSDPAATNDSTGAGAGTYDARAPSWPPSSDSATSASAGAAGARVARRREGALVTGVAVSMGVGAAPGASVPQEQERSRGQHWCRLLAAPPHRWGGRRRPVEGGRAVSPMRLDLGRHRLLRGGARDLGEPGHGELHPAALGVQRLDDETNLLALGEDLPGALGRRVTHGRQGHVAAGPLAVDERPVGGEGLHGGHHLAAQGVGGDEGDERQGVIDRIRGRRPALAPPARLVLGRHRFFQGHRDGTLDLPFPLGTSGSGALRREVQAGHGGLGFAFGGLPLGLLHRLPRPRAADRGAGGEDPTDAGNGFAADEPAPFEQPLVVAVELLERIVRQHRRPGLVGDAQQEGVAAPDGAGRGRDQLTGGFGLLEHLRLALVDAMPERGVDDDGNHVVGVLQQELTHRLVELDQARHGTALSGQVGSVDDDVAGCHLA